MSKAYNPFEHRHDHGPDCDHSHEHGDAHGHDHGLPTAQVDPAQQSLSDALRVSFGILKLVMLVLIVLYLFSGIVWGIPSQEVAIRLRFGQIVGDTPGQAVMKSGKVYFALPYPIEQVVRIPVAVQQLQLNREFWFALPGNADTLTAAELEKEGRIGPLNPEKDGSLITGDGNIIHARWTVKYEIVQPMDFMQNIAAPSNDVKNVLNTAKKIVTVAVEQAVVFAVAQIQADDATRGNLRADLVKTRAQGILDQLHSGIALTEVTPSNPRFPQSVQADFRAVTEAASEKAQKMDQARQQALSALNETAGSAYQPLRQMIDRYERAKAGDDRAQIARLDQRLDAMFTHLSAPRWAASPDLSSEVLDQLWEIRLALYAAENQAADPKKIVDLQQRLAQVLEAAQVPLQDRLEVSIGGKAAQVINEARAFRSSVVAQLQSEALAFNPKAVDSTLTAEGLLQQYKQNPRVFINRRFQDMVDVALTSDVEVFYLPQGQTYLDLSRDQNLKKVREQEKLKAQDMARRNPAGN